MDEYSQAHYNELAKRLVRTVARAFYPDEFVVVLDALLREGFMEENEIGPRLRFEHKKAREVVNQLHKEQLLRSEEVTRGGIKGLYYYIDYQHFVDVVRYRVHLILKAVREKQKAQQNMALYQCPTCGNRFTQMQCLKFLSRDQQFVCPHCCPGEVSRTISQPSFKLVQVDNDAALAAANAMIEKIEYQFGRQDGEHDGIHELLEELKDKPLIRNLPSDNMKSGLTNTAVTDAISAEIEDYRARIGKISGTTKKRARAAGEAGEDGEEDEVEELGTTFLPTRDTSQPEFLQGSRVMGAERIHAAMQQQEIQLQQGQLQPQGQESVVEAKEEVPAADEEENIDWES